MLAPPLLTMLMAILLAPFKIDNPVDRSAAATYTVTYTVFDAAGNAATPVTRTVNVNRAEPEP